MMKMPGAGAALAALVLATACAHDAAGPTPQRAALSSAVAVKFWDVGATVAWTAYANDLADLRPNNGARLWAYLGLAQLRAAEDAAAIRPHPPTGAAIGAASAAILTAFFPGDAEAIAAMLASQQAATPWPGAKHADAAQGMAIGAAAAARVLTYAASDGAGLTDPGTAPVGPGSWLPPAPPGAPIRGNLGARPFYLQASDELRPGPPPAFGSAAFLAALDEVRQIALTRTAAQTTAAQFWNAQQSGRSNRAMNEVAASLIRKYRRSDADAARILFLANSAVYDALVGCFDAKYHYWLIRPAQADPAIVTVFPAPAHPSYPSGHSCVSGAYSAVLAAEFPSERSHLEQLADEASLSRLYAGIHYGFDMQAGLAVGRGAAARALAADLATVAIK